MTLGKIMRQMDLSDFEIIEIDMTNEDNQDLYEDVDTVPRIRLENGAELVGVKSKVNLENWLKENK